MLISQAQADKINFNPIQTNLQELCREIVGNFPVSSEYMIDFECQDSSINAHIDTTLLRHILNNLLSNAIKYSPKGSTVIFKLTRENNLAVCQISDKGIGIPSEDIKQLFEPFHRASNVGDIPGTGLGLAIAKNSVDLHGGEIAIKSEVGVGTTFTVKLPLNTS